MNAQEYEAELKRLLYSLPEQEREEAVAFYRESIADRIDDGLTEEEAVASMASPAEAACAILANRVEAQGPQASEADAAGAQAGGVAAQAGVAGAQATEAAAQDPKAAPEASDPSQQLAQRPSFWTRLRHGQLTPWEWVGVVLSSIIWLPLLAAAFSVALGAASAVLALYLCAWVLIACVWVTGAACVLAAPGSVLFIIWGAQIGSIPYMLVNIGYSLIAFGGGVWILRGALKLTTLFLKGHGKVARTMRKEPAGPEMPTPASTGAPGSASTPAGTGEQPADTSAPASPNAFADPDASASPGTSTGTVVFFRICLILLGAGFASVLAGYLLSGLDWRVFLTSFTRDNGIYIGGVLVEHPERLLLGTPFSRWM